MLKLAASILVLSKYLLGTCGKGICYQVAFFLPTNYKELCGSE